MSDVRYGVYTIHPIAPLKQNGKYPGAVTIEHNFQRWRKDLWESGRRWWRLRHRGPSSPGRGSIWKGYNRRQRAGPVSTVSGPTPPQRSGCKRRLRIQKSWLWRGTLSLR
jgi:hypothetical protein